MKMQSARIEEISDLIQTGKTPPTEQKHYFHGNIPWYTPGDLDKLKVLETSDRTIRETAIKDRKAIIFPKGTVLISCIGEIGKIGIIKNISSSNQQITGIKPKSFITSDYFYYWVKANKKTLESFSNNAVVPILNNASLKKIKIKYPPLEDQKRIVAILDKADALRQKRKQALALLDEFLRSTFLEMFGDPRLNSKGFEMVELKSVINDNDKINYGVVQPGDNFKDGIPIVRVADFKEMKVDKTNLKRINPNIEKDYRRSRLIGDEILIACVGSIGKVVIVDKTLKGFNIVRATARLQCSTKINRIYLAYYLVTEYVQSCFFRATRTVSQPTLNIKQIEETSVLVPPIELQNQFAKIVEQTEAAKARMQQSLQEMENQFSALMQRAFKGEL